MQTFLMKLGDHALVVRTNGGEAGARAMAAGKGKDKDERWLSQDHASCDLLSGEGSEGVLAVIGERAAPPPPAAEKSKAGPDKGEDKSKGAALSSQAVAKGEK